MKKVRIAIGIMVICCAIVVGVVMGSNNFFRMGKDDIDEITKTPNSETDNALNITVGQDLDFTSEIETDILSRHALPDLDRMEKNDQNIYVNELQVMKKIELIGMEEEDFLFPEMKISDIEKKVSSLCNTLSKGGEQINFEGSTSEELQEAINNNPNAIINIKTSQIQLHNTIILRDNTTINGNGVKFVADGLQYGFIGENLSDIYIDDVFIAGNMDYGIYFIDCQNINVTRSEINGCIQKAVCIVGDSDGFVISNNKLYDNMAGTIYLAGEIFDGIIEGNRIENSRGTSNMMAGIVLTSDNPQNKRDIWDNFQDAEHRNPYRGKIYEQRKAPHNILVRNNSICLGNSSGIYSDGAYSCYIIGNNVEQNDKEGICLDNGTIGFYLKENVFKENGRRIRQTDDDLRLDYISELGRMEDGSAKSKLPGVSLDNTAYNIIENNIIINNYGGGIKMVRTTVRTIVMENIIRDNNMGQNDSFHFFGIEVGSDMMGTESVHFDFAPSYENIICRNSITGNHYSGIFIGEECYVNDVFDNIIMEPQMFAVEAISKKFNGINNNISSEGIRNEYERNSF